MYVNRLRKWQLIQSMCAAFFITNCSSSNEPSALPTLPSENLSPSSSTESADADISEETERPEDQATDQQELLTGEHDKEHQNHSLENEPQENQDLATKEDHQDILDEEEEQIFTLTESYKPFEPDFMVHFDFDEDLLNEQNRSALDKIIAGMKKDPLVKILIKGHADKQGPSQYNYDLSRRRAETIRQYLTSRGVNGDRFSIDYFGENVPLDPTNHVTAFRKNRRGEFVPSYEHNDFGKAR